VVSSQILVKEIVSLNPERKIIRQIFYGSLGNDLSILDIGISNIDLVQYRNGVDVDIGTIPISE
jgi:hypothetical protein